MKMEGIATEFAVEIVKSGQCVSKGREVEEIAKKLGIKVKRLQNKDLVRG